MVAVIRGCAARSAFSAAMQWHRWLVGWGCGRGGNDDVNCAGVFIMRRQRQLWHRPRRSMLQLWSYHADGACALTP